MKDYYKVLGVEPGADVALIKSAYRKLARQFHPDLHPGDKAAEERFKDIGEAWEVLGDSQKREKYDADRLKVHSSRPGANKRPPKADYADIMQQFDSFFGKAPAASSSAGKNPLDGSNLFNSFMGKGMGKKK